MKRHWWGVTEAISDPEAGDYVPLSEFIQQELNRLPNVQMNERTMLDDGEGEQIAFSIIKDGQVCDFTIAVWWDGWKSEQEWLEGENPRWT